MRTVADSTVLEEGLKKTLDAVEKTEKNVVDKFNTIGKAFEKAGETLETYVTKPIMSLGKLSVDLAVNFESSFAGIETVVDGTAQQIENLRKGIRNLAMEIPASPTEIAKVAEAAGRLGINTDSILEFSKTMMGLGESTDLSALSAAEALGKLANITSMSQEDFDRLGSSIVDLGNNFGAPESEILSMGMKLADVGTQVGLSESEILGFSAALSSVGLDAKAGGSEFSNLMIQMKLGVETGNDSLNDFARVAGMTSEEFKEAFEEDASGAIISFLKGLNQIGDDGESAIKVLDDMGIKKEELRDTILRASSASDIFTDAVKISTTAWDDNMALTDEANKRYETTANKIEIMKNNMKEFAMELGEIMLPHIDTFMEKLKDLATKFQELSPRTQENIIKFGLILSVIGPVVLGIGSIIPVVTLVMEILPALGTALGLLTGPIGLAVLGIAALTTGGILLHKHFSEDALPVIEHFGDGVSEATKEATEGFLDMNESITRDLETLSITGQEITGEMKDNIVGNISEMADLTTTAINDSKEEAVGALRELLENSSEISEEEKITLIQKTEEAYDNKVKKIEEAQRQITTIMETAAEEHREITESEQQLIAESQKTIAEEGIAHLTDNELEQKIILEKMRDNAGVMSAQQAGEVVKNSISQKEKVIKEVEEQYDEVLKNIIMLRDDVGSISEEEADIAIAAAKREKEESIAHAEEMHNEIVENAKNQAGEHVDYIDWETGEVLSRWGVFKKKTKERMEEMEKEAAMRREERKRKIEESLQHIKTVLSDKLESIMTEVKTFGGNLVTTFSTKFSEAKETVQEKLGEIGKFFTELPGKALKWGENMIGGFIDGMKSMPSRIAGAASSVTSKVGEFLGFNSPAKKGEGRNIVTWGENMIKGFVDGTNSQENLLIKTVKNLMSGLSISLKDIKGLDIDKQSQSKLGLIMDEVQNSYINNNYSSSSSKAQNIINLEGLFKGADLSVRNAQDITKIAEKVIELIDSKDDRGNRRIGGIKWIGT